MQKLTVDARLHPHAHSATVKGGKLIGGGSVIFQPNNRRPV